MIDIHTHIIPKIDDGSRSVEETFALLEEAKEARLYRYYINFTLYFKLLWK